MLTRKKSTMILTRFKRKHNKNKTNAKTKNEHDKENDYECENGYDNQCENKYEIAYEKLANTNTKCNEDAKKKQWPYHMLSESITKPMRQRMRIRKTNS